MEDDPCSWVDTRGVPEANFLHTSSRHSCHAEREVEARCGLELLAQEAKHFHCCARGVSAVYLSRGFSWPALRNVKYVLFEKLARNLVCELDKSRCKNSQ